MAVYVSQPGGHRRRSCATPHHPLRRLHPHPCPLSPSRSHRHRRDTWLIPYPVSSPLSPHPPHFRGDFHSVYITSPSELYLPCFSQSKCCRTSSPSVVTTAISNNDFSLPRAIYRSPKLVSAQSPSNRSFLPPSSDAPASVTPWTTSTIIHTPYHLRCCPSTPMIPVP